MATQSQITANQANALLSTGPRTDAGKAKVSRNRATHHLCGRHVILPGEDEQDFSRLSIELHLDLAPQGALEKAIVDTVAHAEWKLLRIAEWEAQLFVEGLDGDPAAPSRLLLMFSKSADPAEAILRLQRYESATRRAWHNGLKELRLAKAARRTPASLADRADTLGEAKKTLVRLGVPESEWNGSNPTPDAAAPPPPAGASNQNAD